jgi:regulator of replication initiation timing
MRLVMEIMLQEENNTLKLQNEQLSAKLRRAEIVTSSAQEVVSAIRASTGSKKSIALEEEQRLRKMLKVSSFLSKMLYTKSPKEWMFKYLVNNATGPRGRESTISATIIEIIY